MGLHPVWNWETDITVQSWESTMYVWQTDGRYQICYPPPPLHGRQLHKEGTLACGVKTLNYFPLCEPITVPSRLQWACGHLTYIGTLLSCPATLHFQVLMLPTKLPVKQLLLNVYVQLLSDINLLAEFKQYCQILKKIGTFYTITASGNNFENALLYWTLFRWKKGMRRSLFSM